MGLRLPWWYRLLSAAVAKVLAWRHSPRLGPWTFAPGRRVWIHAASLGECKASIAVAKRLPAGLEPVLTASTAAGLERLKAELPGRLTFLAPLDHMPTVERFVTSFGIARVLLVEAELWPGWMAVLGRKGIPVGLVTVRVSGASAGRWKRLWRLFPRLAESLDAVWANAGETSRAQEAGFVRVRQGASLKWAGRFPLELGTERGRHCALSVHRRDAEALQESVEAWRGQWLVFPRRLEDVAFWRGWFRRQGFAVKEDPSGLEAGQAWVADRFGLVSTLVPGCEKAWVSPGHDTWEPFFLGVEEVHPLAKDRTRLDAYQARVEACAAEVLDWLRRA
jgi:3-deoxy-D-manno-octulosonic-acid transferase